MPTTCQTRRWATLCAALFLVALFVIALGGRSAPVLTRYSSSDRADGGFTLTLDAAGRCEIKANRGGAEFDSQGRYRMNGNQCILETRPRPQSPFAILLGFRSKISRDTNWLVRTNGVEYLMSDHRYARFVETGNTNLLHEQLRRVQ